MKTRTLLTISTLAWVILGLLYTISIFFPVIKEPVEKLYLVAITINLWITANILIKIEKLEK